MLTTIFCLWVIYKICCLMNWALWLVLLPLEIALALWVIGNVILLFTERESDDDVS